MLAFLRNIRQLNQASLLKPEEPFVIQVPGVQTILCNLLRLLKLAPEVSCIQIAWQVRGAGIHPTIFIYLAAEKFAAVGSLFPDNFRSFDIFSLSYQKSSSFSHGEILSLMEAVAAVIAKRPKYPPLIGAHNPLGSILYHIKPVFLSDRQNFIHFAGNTRVMHGYDGFGFIRNCFFYFVFIQVHGIRTDIDKNNLSAPENKSVGR